MMKVFAFLAASTLAAAFLSTPLQAQGQGKRPALIRDTEEDQPPEEAPKPKELNPMLAEKNHKIGDYYFKRKNYDAAIQRYLEALEYQPNRVESWESLARAYEKNGQPDKAQGVCRDFIAKYPDSPKLAEFRSRLSRLEQKNPS